MPAPLIALVGRPNVGKSTLFNRLTGLRAALVDPTPGMTRDRKYGRVVKYRNPFRVVDTGGFEENPKENMAALIRGQAMNAIEEADAILFITDAQSGPLLDDWNLVKMLRRTGKPLLIAVNKAEKGFQHAPLEFMEMGCPTVAISATQGRGIQQMVREILKQLRQQGWVFDDEAAASAPSIPQSVTHIPPAESQVDTDSTLSTNLGPDEGQTSETELGRPELTLGTTVDHVMAEQGASTERSNTVESSPSKPDTEAQSTVSSHPEGQTPLMPELDLDTPILVALIGCPNVGKSSLVNRLLKEERQIISDMAGTTRDSVDLPLTGSNGQRYTLIDTAGIRRKSRVSERVEKFSVLAALRSIDRADIAVLALDATREISDQDKRIARHAIEAGRSLLFVVNKWDTVKGGRQEESRMRLLIGDTFPRLAHAPVLFVSAKNGRHCGRILPLARRIVRSARQTIPTGILNRWLADCLAEHPPARTSGKPVKLRYATQVGAAPPSLLLFANRPDGLQPAYFRFLENRLREQFGFNGTPIRIALRKGENPYEPKGKKRRRLQKSHKKRNRR